MASELTLEINGRKRDILRYNYRFHREIRYNRPVDSIWGGEICVEMTSDGDTYFLEMLMAEKEVIKEINGTRKTFTVPAAVSGKIQFIKENEIFRELSFQEAYVVFYGERMSSIGPKSMSTFLVISPMKMEVNKRVMMVKRQDTGINLGWVQKVEEKPKPTPVTPYTPPILLVRTVNGETEALPNEIIDNNDIVTTGNFNDGTLKQLQHTLWKGYDSKPSNLDNRALVSDTKHVNTTIAQAYINNQGQHVTITDAELYLTFLTERAGYLTSIGYYYYKTNEIPNSPDKVDKFIIIPNASIAGDDPYTGWSGSGNKYSRYDAPIQKNTKIQLLYQDENGNVSTKFPAGYTIGYFIIPNGYTPNKGIDYSINYIYSNKEWNKIYAGQQARFISLSTSNGTVVYGVEDGDDTSYEDILFCIDANPNEAIQDPDRPVIDPEEPTVTSSETTYRTYAYEDIWPNGGDYDLNDVIIEHKRAISFNSNNYVLKVEDTFVPVQQSGAATYSNAFAVQYVASQRGSIELPAGAVDETETSSVILFPDAKSVQGNEFTVTRTFADNTLPKKNLESDLNPFIIAQYTAGADNRTEVHLPKKKATGKANAEQIGAEDDAYYINKDGKYPFAIMLPATTGTEGPIRFTPAKETVRIDLEYPDFAKWVESNGATNNDWYLYYQSSKE